MFRAGEPDPLVTSTVPNGRLPQGGWYALQLGTEWQSLGKAYLLRIRSETSQAAPGPRIAYSLGPEYEAGQLYENGAPREIDLIFKYGCVAGLEKLMLTSVNPALR